MTIGRAIACIAAAGRSRLGTEQGLRHSGAYSDMPQDLPRPETSLSGSTNSDDIGAASETPYTAAAYVGAMVSELAEIARRNGLDMLGYILDMAKLEADEITRHSG
jgi:hypothetical protein